LKLLIKEDIIPDEADKAIFWIAPLISVTAGMLAMSALAIGPWFQIADLNVGLLFIVGISALGIFGIVLGGWSSNSHYSLLGALRSAAQLVSYETAAGMAIVSGLLLAGTLSTREIVAAQNDYGVWFIFAAPVGFFIYVVASIAETNRAPFDLPEAESELVAGFHTEYSGFRWALYFLAEYANIFVACSVAVTLFWGGWLRPFPNVQWLAPINFALPFLLFAGSGGSTFLLVKKLRDPVQQKVLIAVALLLLGAGALFLIPQFNSAAIGVFWFLFKVALIIYLLIWFRGTFPRFRYDQLMNIGWKYMIPIGMGALMVNALLGMV
jgi:NADH-quinone oxidoreductase subunit H